jgi:hypothetical protein
MSSPSHCIENSRIVLHGVKLADIHSAIHTKKMRFEKLADKYSAISPFQGVFQLKSSK